ncbi:unnamed protein product [Ceratitis capitata]|uniref:(Mediterranean fruit fly) hypothetical protein n=1 Tax=Ceratitis capitata TaxID=7213 RepID=A0A811U2Q4_CERCA|nr:unnamed protein product [Ceratitis capitata]
MVQTQSEMLSQSEHQSIVLTIDSDTNSSDISASHQNKRLRIISTTDNDRRPGVDYPILSAIPYTNFYCDEQAYPGFFADMETRCQGWHYCDIDGRQASFLCPNGTQFSQAVFVCDWWFNVRCDLSPRLYAINARLYQRPKVNPTRPHRIITKELVDDIFN